MKENTDSQGSRVKVSQEIRPLHINPEARNNGLAQDQSTLTAEFSNGEDDLEEAENRKAGLEVTIKEFWKPCEPHITLISLPR